MGRAHEMREYIVRGGTTWGTGAPMSGVRGKVEPSEAIACRQRQMGPAGLDAHDGEVVSRVQVVSGHIGASQKV